MEGNKRYVQDTLEHPNRNQERREAITAKQFPSSNELEKAIKMNALRMKQYLLNSAPLDKLAKEKKIEIQAAYYHLKTGKIEILSAS